MLSCVELLYLKTTLNYILHHLFQTRFFEIHPLLLLLDFNALSSEEEESFLTSHLTAKFDNVF